MKMDDDRWGDFYMWLPLRIGDVVLADIISATDFFLKAIGERRDELSTTPILSICFRARHASLLSKVVSA